MTKHIASLRKLNMLREYNAAQAHHMHELCIAVNENDQITGEISKVDAHCMPGISLHRAFSVFAYTPDNKLLLQKRSATKITFPSLWTNTCCSHPLYNESEMDGIMGVKRAAIRKLDHELNLSNINEDECLVLGRFLYKATMSDSLWGEHELDYAIVIKNVCPSRISPNTEEVSDVRAVSEDELMKWMNQPAVTFACFLTTVFSDYTTAVKITVNNPRVRSVVDYSTESEKADLGLIDFSIDVDFTKIFNWNVKQIFVYLVAEYQTSKNTMNQVTLWDKIVLRSERVVLDERRLATKYYFLDESEQLRNHQNVTLMLRYHVIPNAGYLRLAQAEGKAIVKFPATYTTSKH